MRKFLQGLFNRKKINIASSVFDRLTSEDFENIRNSDQAKALRALTNMEHEYHTNIEVQDVGRIYTVGGSFISVWAELCDNSKECLFECRPDDFIEVLDCVIERLSLRSDTGAYILARSLRNHLLR
jgi:hypothetical protein